MSDPGDPPYVVVDTNVAVKWYLTEDLEDEALKMMEVVSVSRSTRKNEGEASNQGGRG